MSDLKQKDRIKFEELFGMVTGYVLNFTDKTFQDFFISELDINIDDNKYYFNGGSKAKRLRAFWQVENNFIVGKLNLALLDYWFELKKTFEDSVFTEKEKFLYQYCIDASNKLKDNSTGNNLEGILTDSDDISFKLLYDSIKDSIKNNKPEAALDRLHLFTIKYIKKKAEKYKIDFTKKPLHSIFGEYLKKLKADDLIESEMTERILKSSIDILKFYNDVRNNQSLSHDNQLLKYNESMFILDSISTLIKFIDNIDPDSLIDKVEPLDDDLPF